MWPSIISDLVKAGFSEAKIAALVGTSQPTIHRLKAGDQASTRFEIGDALYSLHRKTCKEAPPK